MLTHKATLIQDIREYLSDVRKCLAKVVNDAHLAQGFVEEDAIKWIIEEELELIYHLFSKDHYRRMPYLALHNLVDRALSAPLSVYTSHYICAPQLDGYDREIRIRIERSDLYIEYYRSPYLLPPPIISLR